ncbi:hypothetical protein [Salipaludibacillus aurantiacus]|uniref:Uncharacterized protein n=1 Tax=Salipaludibacillus aurantiacus TaxID=1601833 RepID=A0A1H9Q9B4_9BACI|nr:hypothetical protein [Salipaludibacillus aurantiacus]SER57146.1 hypothetical protein SAMN05518684_102101 [Salipaludibacillus aurantiacus]
MTKRQTSRDGELIQLMKKRKQIKPSEEARQKSLQAFRNGLNQNTSKDKNTQKLTNRQRIIGAATTVSAAGIAALILLNYDFMPGDLPLDSGTEERTNTPLNEEREEAGNINLDEIKENPQVLERVLNRQSIDIEDLNEMDIHHIYNENLSVSLPDGWSVNEDYTEDIHSIIFTGPESEEMSLYLYENDLNESLYEEQLDDILSDMSMTESTTVSPDYFKEKFRHDFQISSNFPQWFPFDYEKTEMYSFIDEENGRFKELYLSELFGHPMIYTMDVPLDDEESWPLSWVFFSQMLVSSPYTVPGSEGEIHSKYERSSDKTVILSIGARMFEEFKIELYDIGELGLTSYRPIGTEVERVEHDQFVEWRFTDTDVSKNSFYSFGKLNEEFPVDQGKEIMFEAFDIDLAYHEDLGGGSEHHFSYYSGSGKDFYDGYIKFLEIDDAWYYKHAHSDREDNNGVLFNVWLNLFIDHLEWE